ncbi:MAG: FKBP-type peptidyl-prolyl cis-trans isomerase [Rubripirellula sp.]
MDELNRCELRDRSVGAAMKTWLPWYLLSVVLMAAGCRSTADPSPDFSAQLPPSDSETTKWKPVTFIDKPELQTGTGAMDTDAATEFLSTDSGLRYRILRNSDGKKPSADSTVTVNYRGWLNTGKVFDSSYERGEPTTFPLQNVIDGWTEGMQLVGEGGMIELWVPSRLGYGERGSPGSIPAHSNLHFIVELVNVD